MKKRLAFALVFALCAALLCIDAGASGTATADIDPPVDVTLSDGVAIGSSNGNGSATTLVVGHYYNVTYSSNSGLAVEGIGTTGNIPSSNYVHYYKSGDNYYLELNNIKLDDGANAYIIIDGIDLTIILMGDNDINYSQYGGIYAYHSSITFAGTGTLDLIGADYSTLQYAIGVTNGDITVESGSITATAGTAESSYGIYASGNITVNGGSITATAGTAESSYGVYAGGDITVNGGSLTGTGGSIYATAGVAGSSCGVYAGGSITVNGGSLTGAGGSITSSGGNQGEEQLQQILFMSSNGVSASANAEEIYSYGIYSATGITVRGELEGTGGDGAEYSYGVSAPKLTVNSGGEVTGTGGSSTSESIGINLEQIEIGSDLYLKVNSGGEATGTGGQSQSSYGVFTRGDATIDGSITACAGEAGVGSYGFSSDGNVTVGSSGEITARSSSATAQGNVNAESSGMIVTKNLTNYGTIKAISGSASASATGRDAYSKGIDCDDLSNSGTIKAISGSASASATGRDAYSNGIDCNKLNNSGTITATSGSASTTNRTAYSYGIYCYIDLSNSGKITATGSAARAGNEAESYGVYVINLLSMSGGTLTATGGQPVEDADETIITTDGNAAANYGIYAGSANITAGKVNVSAGSVNAVNGNAESYGMYVEGLLTNAGTITADSGQSTASADNDYAYIAGIDVDTLNNSGTITAKSGSATSKSGDTRSYGIFCADTLDNSGTISATGGAAFSKTDEAESCGVYSDGILDNSGTITATSGSATTETGEAISYGLYIYRLNSSLIIREGSWVTFEGTGDNAQAICFGNNVTILLPDIYSWRTSSSDNYTLSATEKYAYSAADTYVEIRPAFTPATGVALSPEALTLRTGETGTLTASVTPDDYSGGVTWTSSNTAVATVDENGIVTAVAPGTATITATVEGADGSVITAECAVTVRSTGGGVNVPATHDIDLVVGDGGSAKTSLSNASAGTTITVTATPDDGFELAYITVDGERISGNTFTMPAHDVTVRVYFASAAMPFTDVPSGAWYYDAVSYVYANGLMDGVSDTAFNPDGTMTRAMVWAILARIDGETVTGSNWAEAARAWAVSSGVSDGENPDASVTREQLATMLWRYAGEPDGTAPLSAWRDAASVSDWAAEAMSWAIDNGIITGASGDTLSPQGTATRAQCAAMLMRFMQA